MAAIETDYLVVGAGAAGMAFTDSLIEHSDAEVVMVDRRHRPGGHWNDAYPFARLHQPSAYYGVSSRPLGSDAVDRYGPNAGFYERATADEICAYFERVLEEQLLPSGRVQFFPMCDYRPGVGGRHRFASLLTGEEHEVTVRRKVVDATYLETPVPATHTPTFDVEPGVRFVPVNELVYVREASARYVVLGAGKTAMDACVWLLDNGVDPDRIRWVRPRDSWLLDRAGWQPGEQVASIIEGISLDLEAAALADSVEDLFVRLERSGRLLRIDVNVTPTMYRCAIVSRHELEQLRRIADVVRLGRVLRLEPKRMVLEQGSIESDPGDVHVDCTAAGLRDAPVRPVFEPDRVTIQQIRQCSPTFNAALIAYVEATRDDPDEQNRLCPVTPYPTHATDWMRVTAAGALATSAWLREPDVSAWVEGSRLNLLRGMPSRMGEERVRQALGRYVQHLEPAIAKLERFLGERPATKAG